MSKWKCEICGLEFENFHAQGFNHKIYCPLCYYKQLYEINTKEIERLNNIIDNARKYIENNQSGCENENGHFHLNFDGDIWELYEMLRRF